MLRVFILLGFKHIGIRTVLYPRDACSDRMSVNICSNIRANKKLEKRISYVVVAGVPGEYDYCWWLVQAVSPLKQQSCIFCAPLADLTTINCCSKCFRVIWVSCIQSVGANQDHCDRQSLATRSDRKTETKCRVLGGFSFLHSF